MCSSWPCISAPSGHVGGPSYSVPAPHQSHVMSRDCHVTLCVCRLQGGGRGLMGPPQSASPGQANNSPGHTTSEDSSDDSAPLAQVSHPCISPTERVGSTTPAPSTTLKQLSPAQSDEHWIRALSVMTSYIVVVIAVERRPFSSIERATRRSVAGGRQCCQLGAACCQIQGGRDW